MDSLYAKYLSERTDDKIIESDEGFITYRYLNDTQVYIIDLYVLPLFRHCGVAASLANKVCEEAKEKGCTEMLGTVNPSCKGATESILVLIAYHMRLSHSGENVIVFKKDI